MTLSNIEKSIKLQVAQRLQFQRALSAAASMMLQLKINPGNELPFLLNQPKAKDNKEAVCAWILTEQGGKLVDEESYPTLLSRLRATLETDYELMG